jgi:Undecaprenyl-phosphate glucose phosphotransferase
LAVISSSPPPPVASAERRPRRRPRIGRAVARLSLIAADLTAVNGALILAYIGGADSIRNAGLLLPEDNWAAPRALALLSLIALLIFAGQQLYHLRRGMSRFDESVKIVAAVSLTLVLAIVIVTLLVELGLPDFPWTGDVLVRSWFFAIVGCIGLRAVQRRVMALLRRYDFDTSRVLIIGARESGLIVWNTIRRRPDLGLRVQGFLSASAPVGSTVEGLDVLGTPEHIGEVIRRHRIDQVIIALSGRSPQELVELISLAEDEAVEIKVYPDTFQLITNNEVSIGDLPDLPLISVKNAALDNPWNRLLKRGLDLVLSTLFLIVGSPLMVLIALAVRLESRGPVFFLQERVGMDNQPFWMLKFRTMRVDAEQLGTWTVENDPRVTRVGKLLRRTSLDELPQLINVLIGDMSIVGPRPEQARWVEQFSQQIPRYMRRHKEKAGLTGWAQVNGLRGDTSIEERTRYDLYYVENWSLLFDLKIILRTLLSVLSGRQSNAY